MDEDKLKQCPNHCQTYLPFITDELWEMFNDTDLMTWDLENNRPDWTQTAVDFAAYLPTAYPASTMENKDGRY